MKSFKLIDTSLTDRVWLETLCDLGDLDAPPELMATQLKCRPHLEQVKRALYLEHLKEIN